MSWRLRYSQRAIRDMRNIPLPDRQAINDRLASAALDPGSVDFRKLTGSKSQWRVRVGRWRATLDLDNQTGMMTVLRVLPRDRAYRG